MSNFILRNRDTLARSNYVRKADPAVNYWFDFSYGKLQKYIERYGNNFNMIIVGSEQTENDYYVIPFSALRHMFTTEYLSEGRMRWIGTITSGQLRISNYPDTLDIRRYYGNKSLVAGGTDSSG